MENEFFSVRFAKDGSIARIVDKKQHRDVLTGPGGGNLNGNVNFTGIQNLVGGSGNDAFKIQGGSVGGLLDGGLGINTLDYSGNGKTGTLTNGATWTAGKVP
jgi:hypothetical protein